MQGGTARAKTFVPPDANVTPVATHRHNFSSVMT